MTVICTICARGGSIGVPNKNIKSLARKPLIAHSILQAKKTKLFESVVVSSDSSKIRHVAKKWGADYVIDRPAELATAEISKLPAIQHAVLEMEKVFGKQFEYIIDLDATAPLRTVEDISNAFKMFVKHPSATNLVTACPARKSPYFNMLEINLQGFVDLVKKTKDLIHRRQDTPSCYDMNASIYIWKRHELFNAKSAIMGQTLLYLMPEERSMDIDSNIDFEIVKLLMKKRKKF